MVTNQQNEACGRWGFKLGGCKEGYKDLGREHGSDIANRIQAAQEGYLEKQSLSSVRDPIRKQKYWERSASACA
jgi:hypothetical protein